MPKTEREKMLAGELYLGANPELATMRKTARDLFHQYNQTADDEKDKRHSILRKLMGKFEGTLDIQPPFFCDYGCHIFLGKNCFMNFNCIILDCAEVHIGNFVQFGPNVQIYTAYHPLQASERLKGPEMAAPVHIKGNVWIGGGAIICQNVTIGENTTIGAGSVVTKNVPANVFAAGNPCRVIRKLKP